ncbi:MAG: 3-dehydroquinate synthase [Planctomycetota bacterium]
MRLVPAETASQRAYDAEFAVPCVHRLRFTHDVLGDDAGVLLECLHPTESRVRVLVCVDAGVAESDPSLRVRLDAFFDRFSERVEQAGSIVTIDGGEACKNSGIAVEAVLKAINENDLDRRNYVLVIGGGAVLDAVGYATAVAHRGVRLVRLPTTTLAQDDSGVGVKNAINVFGKKNWQGTFAVPWAVINDETLLKTLPDRDYRNGFSEAVKVALLKDAEFFDELCQNASRIAHRDPEASRRAIEQSALLHLRHITEGGDPFEALEARPLDFGHWSAHRLEPMTNFELRHGEAVAIGLALDCLYSVQTQGFDPGDSDRVIRCLQDLGIPLGHPALEREDEILVGLEEFRQHLGGRLTITLLRGVGDPVDVHEIDAAVMRQCIRDLRQRSVSP